MALGLTHGKINKNYNNNFPTILDQMKISFDNVTYFEGSRLYMKNGDELIHPIDLEKACRHSG